MGKSRFSDGQAGGRNQSQVYIPAALQADATKSQVVFSAPEDCKLLQVIIVSQAAITGTDTDSFNLNLINKGSDGTGTTELANLDFASGQDAVAFDGQDLLAEVGTDAVSMASATALSKGDVLAVERELVANGLATPELCIIVVYQLT